MCFSRGWVGCSHIFGKSRCCLSFYPAEYGNRETFFCLFVCLYVRSFLFFYRPCQVWSLRRFQPLHSIRGHAGPVLALCISIADGIIVSSGRDNRIKVSCFFIPVVSTNSVSVCCYKLVRASLGLYSSSLPSFSFFLQIWKKSSFECLATLPQTSHALSIRIDNGRLFAGFDDGSIRVCQHIFSSYSPILACIFFP